MFEILLRSKTSQLEAYFIQKSRRFVLNSASSADSGDNSQNKSISVDKFNELVRIEHESRDAA